MGCGAGRRLVPPRREPAQGFKALCVMMFAARIGWPAGQPSSRLIEPLRLGGLIQVEIGLRQQHSSTAGWRMRYGS